MPPSAFAVSHALPLQRPALARVCPAAPFAPRPARHQAAPFARATHRASLPGPHQPSSATPPPDPQPAESGPAAQPPAALALARAVLRGAADTARLAALSAALLLGAGGATTATGSTSRASAAPSAPTASRSAPSDVEAAAMTLAAVTVGGLVMRVIVNARRDESAEQGRVEAECARLAEEERNRALRKERRRLEGGSGLDALDGSDGTGSGGSAATTDDDSLMSELRQRMATLEDGGADAGAAATAESEQPSGSSARKSDAKGGEKNVTGAAPSGMGSAVLERPDSEAGGADGAAGDGADGEDGDGADAGSEQKLASVDEQDMLKRMWNLSPPDKEQK